MKLKNSLLLLAATLFIAGCGEEKSRGRVAAPANDTAVETPAAVAPANDTAVKTPVAAPAGMTPLQVKLPPVLIIGTPTPFSLPNLEPAEAAKNRAPVLVPEGTVNLAKGKTVTSSDDFPIVGELSYITDGDKDADEGYEVELAPGEQWIQIDLEKESPVYAVAIWHYHRQKRVYHSVVVQLSNDPEFKTGVTEVFNTDLKKGKDLAYIETNLGRVVPVNGTAARYVRLYSTGNTSTSGNHYVEVEVYGVAK